MLDISIQHKDFEEEERIVCLEKNSTTSDFIGEPQRLGSGLDGVDPHILESLAEQKG